MVDYSIAANRQKMLDLIAKAEGADYDTIVGGGKFSDFSSHPNIVGLRTKEGPSTAAGRYQITGTTYNDIAPKLGLSDFSKETQDKIAIKLIERAGALDLVDKGDINGAVDKLGNIWASLPSSPYSQPKRSDKFIADFIDSYDKNIAPKKNAIQIAQRPSILKAQPSALATGNEGVDIPQYIAQPATKAAVDAMQYDDFLNKLTGETGGGDYLQNVIDAGMPQQKINIPMLDVDADFYNPQQDAKWLQAPDQGPAPSMVQRLRAALPNNPMQQTQAIQAPVMPQQAQQQPVGRQPQSFEFTRNRLGLATLLDELEQNEAQAEGRQAKAALVNNPAFVGPSGEQMEGMVQGRRDKLSDYLTQAASAKAKGLGYLGDLGTGAENRQLQANQMAAALQQALAGNIRESDSEASRLKQVLILSLLRQQQAPRADLRSLQMLHAADKLTDDQYNAVIAKELERLGVE